MLRRVPWKFLVSEIKKDFSNDSIPNGAAALAYYLTLAIFPALILVLSLIAYLPIPNVDQVLLELMSRTLPPEAVQLLNGVIQEVTSSKQGGLLSLGAIGTLWAASNGTLAIMQQLNVAYGVQEKRSFLRVRGVSIGLTLLLGVLIISAFSLVVLGEKVEHWIASLFGGGPMLTFLFSVLKWATIFSAFLLSFSLTYSFGPNIKQKFKLFSPGSIFGVVVVLGCSLLFRLYISHFNTYSATYGSLGTVIIFMLWLYICGTVMILGSKMNALLVHESPEKLEEKAS